MLITILGDVYLNKKYDVDFTLDSFIFNLEYTISEQGDPATGKVNLKTEKSFIKETFGIQPKAVCLANNHIFDYGIEAFNDTLHYLDSQKVEYFGAGNERDNYNNPVILRTDGKKIALLGYTCPSTHPAYMDNYTASELNISKIRQSTKTTLIT